jgi:hypothetical protein
MTMTLAESHSPGVIVRAFPILPPEEHRRREAARQRRWRLRNRCLRAGGVVAEVHVNRSILYGLQRLGLVAEDERDPETIAGAVCYVLQNTLHELGTILQRLAPGDDR